MVYLSRPETTIINAQQTYLNNVVGVYNEKQFRLQQHLIENHVQNDMWQLPPKDKKRVQYITRKEWPSQSLTEKNRWIKEKSRSPMFSLQIVLILMLFYYNQFFEIVLFYLLRTFYYLFDFNVFIFVEYCPIIQ